MAGKTAKRQRRGPAGPGRPRAQDRGRAFGGIGIVIAILYFLLGGNPGDLDPDAPGRSALRDGVGTSPSAPMTRRWASSSPLSWRAWRTSGRPGSRTWARPMSNPSLSCSPARSIRPAVLPARPRARSTVPGTSKVYIDLSFFEDIAAPAPGRRGFRHAYVIAHEVGHHVQNLLGINDQVMARRAG